MNITDVLNKFNEKLNENSWWSRFVNSQFVQMMSVFGGQVIYICQTYAARALTEGFISTATRRASILAAAEDRGYVGRFIEPAAGSVSIKNNTEETIILPPEAELLTSDQVAITLPSNVEIKAGETITGVRAKQYEALSVEFDIDSDRNFQTLLLSRDITAEVADLEVYVVTDGVAERWKKNPLFRMSRNESKHYVLVYTPTEQLGIRFGDGSMGMKPPVGSVVRVDIKASRGDFTLSVNQPLEPAGNIGRYIDSLEVKTDTIITGGGGQETTEETRNRAQYYVPYDEQVIWGGDYRHFVQTFVTGTSWLNIWGEAIQEKITGFDVHNINRIFFSGHKPGSTQKQLETEIIEALESVPNELNKHFEYVPTNELPFTINFTAIAKKSVIIEDAESALREALESNFGVDSPSFNELLQSDDDSQQCYAQVKVKDIWRVIESLGLFLSYEVETVGMQNAIFMNDFVFMNVAGSQFNIAYPGVVDEKALV